MTAVEGSLDVPPGTADQHSSKRRLRLPQIRLPKRARPVVESKEAEDTGPKKVPSPTAYRTFSHKLAPGLTAAGGALAAIGAIGPWVRATEVEAPGLQPQQVTAINGIHEWYGVALGILGAVTVVISLLWLVRSLLAKLLPVLCAAGIITLVAWRLPLVDQQVRDLAKQAESQLNFTSYTAGFGWGAWLMLVGTVLLGLGVVVGVLRELDVRKGDAR
jgi:hypothetical protein